MIVDRNENEDINYFDPFVNMNILLSLHNGTVNS